MNKATPQLATGMKLSSPGAFKAGSLCLLTGFVLVECTTETALTLDDFVVGLGDKISSREFACSN